MASSEDKADFVSTTFQNLVKSGFFKYCYGSTDDQLQPWILQAYKICDLAWIEEEKNRDAIRKEQEFYVLHCRTCQALLKESLDGCGMCCPLCDK